MPQELLCRRDFIAVGDFILQGLLYRRDFIAVGDFMP